MDNILFRKWIAGEMRFSLELLQFGNCWWGFNIVEKNDKSYLVFIGMGNSGEPQFSTIESFMLNVLDLSKLEIVYRSYINCDIDYK